MYLDIELEPRVGKPRYAFHDQIESLIVLPGGSRHFYWETESSRTVIGINAAWLDGSALHCSYAVWPFPGAWVKRAVAIWRIPSGQFNWSDRVIPGYVASVLELHMESSSLICR